LAELTFDDDRGDRAAIRCVLAATCSGAIGALDDVGESIAAHLENLGANPFASAAADAKSWVNGYFHVLLL
jgi:hypothetical protein